MKRLTNLRSALGQILGRAAPGGSARRTPAPCKIEPLEARQMMSATFTGTAGKDVIDVVSKPGNAAYVDVWLNKPDHLGVPTKEYQWSDIGNSLTIECDGGNGPSDPDTVNVGTDGHAGTLAGDVVVRNNAHNGAAVLNVNDSADATARTLLQTRSGAFDEIAVVSGPRIYYRYSDVGSAKLTTGRGNDSVLLFAANTPITLDSGGGTDNVDIGLGNTQGIYGNVTVRNAHGRTDLTVDDRFDLIGRNVVNSSGPSNSGRLSGIANQAHAPVINYRYNEISKLTLTTGSGGDNIDLRDENPTFDPGFSFHVNAGPGNDFIDTVNLHRDFVSVGTGNDTWLKDFLIDVP